jgi:hypothetical protein
MGTASGDEHGASLAQSGEAATGPAIFSLQSTTGLPKGFETLDLKEAKALLEELAS